MKKLAAIVVGLVILTAAVGAGWIAYSSSADPPQNQTETKEIEYKWIDWWLEGGAAPGGVYVGNDSDGSEIYLGRTEISDDLRPGKFIPSKRLMWVSFRGLEHRGLNLQVIVGQRLTWVRSRYGAVPCNAVPGGVTSGGERIYAGRVLHEGTPTAGAVIPSEHRISVPFDGVEHWYEDYEVLVAERIKC